MKKCECGQIASRRINDIELCADCFVLTKMPVYLLNRGVPMKYTTVDIKHCDVYYNPNNSLFIVGKVGTGKTYLSVCIMKEDIKNARLGVKPSGVFISLTNLISIIKRSYDTNSNTDDLINYYSTIKNLFLDDIGIDKATEWLMATVYQIIDYRYTNEFRTVFTSNLDFDGLHERLGGRTVSRIIEMCDVIELKGEDRRLQG